MQELTFDFQEPAENAEPAPKETPMMKQYREVKQQVEDAILFFRLGDFYEIFGEDAKLAAPILGVTLTARNKGPHATPMCGVPFHAADSYIQKLLKAGYKVAMCEQVSDPNLPGLVERKLSKVITPATHFFDSILEEKSAQFILCLHKNKDSWAILFADLSTGDFFLYEGLSFEEFQSLVHLYPYQELLMSEAFVHFVQSSQEQAKLFASFVQNFKGVKTQRKIPYHAEGLLESTFPGWLLQDSATFSDVSTELLALCLDYLHFTQQGRIRHAKKPQPPQKQQVWMDHVSYRNLEIFEANQAGGKSLYQVLALCQTGMGLRKMREWMGSPLREASALEKRREALAFFYDNPILSQEVASVLANIGDLERLLAKIASAQAGPKEMLYLLRSLLCLQDLQALDWRHSSWGEALQNLETDFEFWAEAKESFQDLIPAKWRDGDFLKDSAHPQLQEYRTLMKDAQSGLQRIEKEERQATGIESLKVVYSRVFGYMIEVSKAHMAKVPSHYLRKQTLANAERFVNERLHEYEVKVLEAKEKAIELERECLEMMQKRILEKQRALQSIAAFLAELDVLLTWGQFARKNHYVRPHHGVQEKRKIELVGLRHPVLESLMERGAFVPNNVFFEEENVEMMVLTGPNMSGKSTYLRQLALALYLAHIGMYVPAEKADLPLVDALFTRIGASDNLAEGQSTFMVEMQETARILKCATKDSLLILDEVGRGTSTYDGLSLAWAIVQHLAEKVRAFTIFATHYHELIDWADSQAYVKNASIRVEKQGEDVLFMHQLQEGGIPQSFGLDVAKLAGVPEVVLLHAKEVLDKLESKKVSSQVLEKPVLERRLNALALDELSPKQAWDFLHQIQKDISS